MGNIGGFFMCKGKNKFSTQKQLYFVIKRFLDIIVSLLSIILLSPIFLIISILIKLDDNGPIFYTHKRVGQCGTILNVYKFRSMTTRFSNFEDFYETLDENQKKEWNQNFKLEKDPRITKIGAVLRKTSLDELPQLLNVFQGNMTFIGPRPITQEELDKFKENQEKYLSIKPGLTGYWAVNGRSSTTYEERIQLELYYVDHCSLWLDIKIFFKTVFAVVKRDGAV